MNFTSLDITVFAAFYALVLGVSFFKSRGKKDSAGYFLGGRSLTWQLIGVSIVAANISTEQFVGMAGQGAGEVGLAVSAWQLMGSVGIVLIALTLLPRFLQAGIYTMPEFLEYRYNTAARSIMAILTVIIYMAVLLTAVLYSGGLTLQTIFGMDLTKAVWAVGLVAAVYTTFGGLKAVAWADLFQGLALLVGGLVIFFMGLNECGGWNAFATANEDKLHMILPADHPGLPWTGIVSGMWIVMLYYCGLNQFIVQRNLAAKTLRDGQIGVIFAGALWLLVPFAIVMPGIMANTLYSTDLQSAADEDNKPKLEQYEKLKNQPSEADLVIFKPDEEWQQRFPGKTTEIVEYNQTVEQLAKSKDATAKEVLIAGRKPDAAFPTLIKKLIPGGMRGFMFAAIIGAIISSLASMINSASTIFTMDIYHRLLDRQASQGRLVFIGRIMTIVCVVVGCLLAPQLVDPKFGGVFQFIQQFQGYIWPGIVAAFVFGIMVERAPGSAGVAALISGPLIYGLFQAFAPNVYFLLQVAITFQLVLMIMGLITFWKPLKKPRSLPKRENMNLKTSPQVVKLAWLVIAGVVIFFIVFW